MVSVVLFEVCLFVCLSASVTLPENFDHYKAVITFVMHIQWVMTFKMTSWFAHLVTLTLRPKMTLPGDKMVSKHILFFVTLTPVWDAWLLFPVFGEVIHILMFNT